MPHILRTANTVHQFLMKKADKIFVCAACLEMDLLMIQRRKNISKIIDEKNKRSRLQKGDVLLSTVGTIGFSA